MVLKRNLNDMKIACLFKLCLVAKRIIQEEEIDYSDTLALDVSFKVLLLFVGKLVSKGWYAPHAGSFNRYINGHIDGEPNGIRNEVIHK